MMSTEDGCPGDAAASCVWRAKALSFVQTGWGPPEPGQLPRRAFVKKWEAFRCSWTMTALSTPRNGAEAGPPKSHKETYRKKASIGPSSSEGTKVRFEWCQPSGIFCTSSPCPAPSLGCPCTEEGEWKRKVEEV